jgi:hypothetical protein
MALQPGEAIELFQGRGLSFFRTAAGSHRKTHQGLCSTEADCQCGNQRVVTY